MAPHWGVQVCQREGWGNRVAYRSQFLDRDGRAHHAQAKIRQLLCEPDGLDPEEWDFPPKTEMDALQQVGCITMTSQIGMYEHCDRMSPPAPKARFFYRLPINPVRRGEGSDTGPSRSPFVADLLRPSCG
jgi:hypothetical protein